MRSLWLRILRAVNRWLCRRDRHRWDTRGSWSRCRRQHHVSARYKERHFQWAGLPLVERIPLRGGECRAWRPKITRPQGGTTWS